MTASLDLFPPAVPASAILSERIARLAVLLPDGRTARHRGELRAPPGACEGLKRTTIGSEPDKLPVIRGEVLDKTAAFYDPGEPELRPAKPAGDRKKLLFCPDDK